MFSYRKRVDRDLERWHAAGHITSDALRAIRLDLEQHSRALGLANALAILAAVLIGFSVMSFVAANWQDMPRLMRLVLMLAALWGSYALSDVLARKGMHGFSDAAILAGVAIFGGNIMLISQMYHMDGNLPDFIFVWGAAAFLTGVLLRSNPALAFAMVLAVVWGCMQSANRGMEVYWPFLIPWAIISAAFYAHRWRPGLHLSGLALMGFIVSLGYMLNKGHAHGLVTALGLLVVGASFAGRFIEPSRVSLWHGVFNYGLVIVLAGLLALQFWENPTIDMFALLAVLAIALLLGAITWGVMSGNRGAVWIGYSLSRSKSCRST